ncbi:TPA: NADH-quinone oxidoreductase subunit NuoE [candidate division WOR-3 bacterium]|uniref:NADH-quinone oxidoreductase subunit NuoE n=1 Tax=candidate division WOR-3 bacterium TaxID=2052148 RepID=A0A350H908_UNCW3|nr:NADH-quinone oxidoreductase subunit NuoE [candidate division WOR-3 bacterium]
MTNDDRSALMEIVGKYKSQKGSLIPVLQNIQEYLGYISKESVEFVSEQLNYPESDIYGVVTFYAQFKLEKPGKHGIKVCQGTACHVIGADTVRDVIFKELNLKKYGTTEDMKFTVEEVACLGCCSLAPVIMIDGQVFGKLTMDKIKKILNSY